MEELFVVQHIPAAPPHGAQLPKVYRVVAFAGDTVWGVNADSGMLAKVNRPALDGSGRVMLMEAHPTLGGARASAAALAAGIGERDAAERLERDAAAALKVEADRARYPNLEPLGG